jgi:hypothetical protein
MSERMVLTVGWIPSDATTPTILVGDPEQSKTIEADFEILGDEIIEMSSEFRLNVSGRDWFNASSPLFAGLSEAISHALKIPGPPPSLLDNAWALFQWEQEHEVPELKIVGDENSGGEFANPDGAYNGCFYVRYYAEEEDEVFGEQVVVMTP